MRQCGLSPSPLPHIVYPSLSFAADRYARFLFCREHKTARECPECNNLQVGDPSKPEMQCSGCHTKFCYNHGGAHPEKSCADYTASISAGAAKCLNVLHGSVGRSLCSFCCPVSCLGFSPHAGRSYVYGSSDVATEKRTAFEPDSCVLDYVLRENYGPSWQVSF